MNKVLAALLLISTLTACRNNRPIVDTNFTDSLLKNYSEPAAFKTNAAEIKFWGNRIDPKKTGLVNELKYAASLAGRFHLTGNIGDLERADSILLAVDSVYNYKEASPKMALARNCLLEHRFNAARNYFLQAAAVGIEPYDFYSTSFDISLELGQTTEAKKSLDALGSTNDYGYYFRLSKWEHLNSEVEKATSAMKKATGLSGPSTSLQQASLSNTADLYLHEGELQKAYDLYMTSIKLDASDLHSIMGIAWITLVHDEKDQLAEKILQFVSTKTKSPEPLYKMVSVATARGDANMQMKYAALFETKVTDSVYGNMYNKYLIDLYTGILNKPAAAEALAVKELKNRTTPQTYTWYAYALLKNNKREEAFKIYKQHISGKPLEALELYWVGKLMQGLNKNYNAAGFLKAAYKNRFDLSPDKVKDLETIPGLK